MKKQKLRKTIIFGLLLSTSFYGNVWAAEFNQKNIHFINGYKDTFDEDVKVTLTTTSYWFLQELQ